MESNVKKTQINRLKILKIFIILFDLFACIYLVFEIIYKRVSYPAYFFLILTNILMFIYKDK